MTKINEKHSKSFRRRRLPLLLLLLLLLLPYYTAMQSCQNVVKALPYNKYANVPADTSNGDDWRTTNKKTEIEKQIGCHVLSVRFYGCFASEVLWLVVRLSVWQSFEIHRSSLTAGQILSCPRWETWEINKKNFRAAQNARALDQQITERTRGNHGTHMCVSENTDLKIKTSPFCL